MKSAVGMAVGMAIQTGDAQTGPVHLSIRGLVELLLWKRREQEPEAFHLDRRQDADHHIEVIVDGEKFPLRHVPQIGP